MNQANKKDVHAGQIEYLGRWVDRKHFAAFVYNKTEQRLAKSYDEFENLLGSGLWFISKEDAEKAYQLAQEKEKEIIESTIEPEVKPMNESLGKPQKEFRSMKDK